MMRVAVLGHRGMLGHVVAGVLRAAGHTVLETGVRHDPASPERFLEAIGQLQAEAVVNCIALPPGSAPKDLVALNTDFPISVARHLGLGPRFIHPSTDGVFRADLPGRSADEEPDATDPYGKSKAAAEVGLRELGATIIRCSIIGPELGTGHSLLNWVRSQTGPISGYTNQVWNGITTLTWARICLRALVEPPVAQVIQPGFVPPVSKQELLSRIVRIWGLPGPVLPANAPQGVGRWLRPNVGTPPLEEQLLALREYRPQGT